MDDLKLYRLVPAAAPDDPNWDLAPSHGVVVVAALTPGDARVVASEAEHELILNRRWIEYITVVGTVEDVGHGALPL